MSSTALTLPQSAATSSRSPLAGTALSQPENLGLAAGQLQRVWITDIAFTENETFAGQAAETLSYNVSFDHDTVKGVDEAIGQWVALRLNVEVVWRDPSNDDFTPPFDLSLSVAGLFTWEGKSKNPSC